MKFPLNPEFKNWDSWLHPQNEKGLDRGLQERRSKQSRNYFVTRERVGTSGCHKRRLEVGGGGTEGEKPISKRSKLLRSARVRIKKRTNDVIGKTDGHGGRAGLRSQVGGNALQEQISEVEREKTPGLKGGKNFEGGDNHGELEEYPKRKRSSGKHNSTIHLLTPNCVPQGKRRATRTRTWVTTPNFSFHRSPVGKDVHRGGHESLTGGR